jgi:hypothetical protein
MHVLQTEVNDKKKSIKGDAKEEYPAIKKSNGYFARAKKSIVY